jgi:hypothetical protein
MLTDPYWLAGVLGHIDVLAAYDSRTNRYVQISELNAVPNKFKVAYLLGRIEEKIHMLIGELNGPQLTPSGVKYWGQSDDTKLQWTLDINLKQNKPTETLVEFVLRVDMMKSFFDRVLGTPEFLSRHIIEDHLIPYIKLYMRPIHLEQPTLEPTKLFEKEGKIPALIQEALRATGGVPYGVIVIKGLTLSGKVLVKDGKPVEIEASDKTGTASGEQALLKFITTDDVGVVTLYSMNLDALALVELNRIAESALREKKEQTQR